MPPTDSVYRFGPFSLHPAGRLLLHNGAPVGVGARALDILTLLVQRAGEFVSKEDLFRNVWPDTFVEETSLRVHIVALRKALGGSEVRYIENAPGKGYKFTAEVFCEEAEPRTNLVKAARGSRHELPVRLSRMIGRAGAVEDIASKLLTKRFVTITGEGGVGKTTLSLAVAEVARDDYPHGTVFVDLAVVAHPSQLVTAFARALGLMISQNAPTRAIGEAIGNQALLFVVDNCEHMVRDAALVVVDLLEMCPSLRVLATSREALRAGFEQVYRLESLPCPPVRPGISAAEALRYESIQLLVDRVSAAADGFTLCDADAEHAAELCRALDGVPLAIELAAARVGFFGLHGLLMRLPDRLRILTAGHRTVMPRHQTLRALYDWSYDLLEDEGKAAFARLSVFPGHFSLEAAMTLMPWTDRAKALTIFLDLVSKSLVAADLGAATRRYRLLDTARVYATEKLDALGVASQCRLAYADYLIRTLEAANREWVREKSREWIDRYSPLADDVVATLRWLRSEPHQALVFAQLTITSYQLALQLSQLDAHRHSVTAALERLDELPDVAADLRVQLATLFGAWVVIGFPEQSILDGWMTRALAMLDAGVAKGPLLCVVCVANLAYGDYRRLLRNSERLEAMCEADGDVHAAMFAKRMQSQARHFLGDFAVSKRLAQEVLAFPGGQTLRHGPFVDNMDRRVSLGILLAKTHWIEGRSAEARGHVQRCIEIAGQEIDHAKCQILAMAAIPIAMWEGDTDLAASRLDELSFLIARQPSVTYWTEWVAAYEALLSIGTLFQPVRSLMLLDYVAALSTTFQDERLLPRAESGASGWCAPEVIRGYGHRLLSASNDNVDEAFHRFQQAHQLAGERGAARWELRAAISLAELELQRNVGGDAERLLLASLAGVLPLPDDPDVSRAAVLVETLRDRKRRVPTVAA